MAEQKKKTPTAAKENNATKELEAARDAVSTATGGDAFEDFGGEAVAASADFEAFINAEDLHPGAIVHGLIHGGKLLPDTERGGYRVVFVLELKRPLGAHEKGALVGLGERAKLKGLRTLTLGSEVMVRADGKQKLKGGKTMHTFSVKARPNPAMGAKTVAQQLTELWKSSAAAGDVWNNVAEDAPADGGEPTPF